MHRLLMAAAFLCLAAVSASAQTYPSGPVTMVIPFAAGGPTDVLGRIVAENLQKTLGQSVVVENVGGAGGMTGGSRVAKAKPDGQTIMVGTVGTHAQNQTLYARPQYDAVSDFTPVALIAEVPLVLLTKKTLPANSLQEFIAYAKENQAKMNYASAGNGSAVHLGCVMFNMAIGVTTTHVPYRGSGPAMNDLISGQVDYFCDTVSGGVPQIQSNTVKGLAYFGKTRSPALPDLPTAQEQGLAGFEAYTWNAIFAPKGTPEAIVKRLNEAAIAAMEDEGVKTRLGQLGAQIVPPERRTPGHLADFVKSEVEKWAAPIKASGARIE
jgi:tripartite-type tricarboxylate transporter receptor subunit TctC